MIILSFIKMQQPILIRNNNNSNISYQQHLQQSEDDHHSSFFLLQSLRNIDTVYIITAVQYSRYFVGTNIIPKCVYRIRYLLKRIGYQHAIHKQKKQQVYSPCKTFETLQMLYILKIIY